MIPVRATVSAPPGANRAPLRLHALDYLRGAAVLLMVLDHVVALLGPGELQPLRILTRLAMPIFALTIGALANRPLSRRRRIEWAWACVAALGLGLQLGLGFTGLLLVWFAIGRALAGRLRPTTLWVFVAAGLMMGANGIPWLFRGDYHPAEVIGLVCLGRLIGVGPLNKLGLAIPWEVQRLLGFVGRRPLLWYLGHLAALCGVLALV